MTVKRRKIGKLVARAHAVIPLIVLWAVPSVAMAASADAPEIGEADLVVSLVLGRHGQTTRELAIKDSVYSQEIIETDANAATRIVFLDGTELSMGPSSRMVLDRYVYDPSAGTGELAMRMVTGVFEFASGDIPSSGYNLGTPFGNLAVRGTRCVLDIAAGSRLVLQCSELGPEGVSIAGEAVSDNTECLLVPLPGTGNPVYLSTDECEEELRRVPAMFALLGLVGPGLSIEVPVRAEFFQGAGSGNGSEPPGFRAVGTSPQ
jgi:hypothetical protein